MSRSSREIAIAELSYILWRLRQLRYLEQDIWGGKHSESFYDFDKAINILELIMNRFNKEEER